MTHPAYLLARMHPKNVRFDIGTGGVPELTSSDIAGALGMVPGGIGRELLCLAWWPDSRSSIEHHALNRLNTALLSEWSRRESLMLDAMLAIATSDGRESLRRAQKLYSAAHADRWPSINQVENDFRHPQGAYGLLPQAVLNEVIHPRRCPQCEGRGSVHTRTGAAKCTRCDESGMVSMTNTDRAEALGITEANYRQRWDAPYAWLMDHCTDALRKASKALESAAA